MQSIGVHELQQQTGEILRRVREDGEAFDVIDRGQIVARLVPAEETPRPQLSAAEWLARWNQLSDEISAQWGDEVDCAEAIREQRREL